MKEYEIDGTIQASFAVTFTVQAESRDEARDLAMAMIQEGRIADMTIADYELLDGIVEDIDCWEDEE